MWCSVPIGASEDFGLTAWRFIHSFVRNPFILTIKLQTRMVQLPATAAIEYVAACCRTRTRTKTGTKTKIGTITKTVLGAYARSPQVQCIYAPSRLSVPNILA